MPTLNYASSNAVPARLLPAVQPALASRLHENAWQVDRAVLRSRLKASLFGRPHDVRLGRFELLRRLGQGSEGTVFEARDPLNGSIVALKQLHPAKVASGASLEREFRIMAELVHPNLAVLHELFHVDAQWFYTMGLTAGDDFLTYVRAEPRALGERLQSTLVQILRGLAALHDGGNIHRDLKPSNVLVRPDGHVVILDYGLVVAMNDESAIGCSAGTPAYAAPEQAGGRAEPASDLYALGAMLYRALTGDRLPPLAARSDAEVGRAVVSGRASVGRVRPHLYVLCERLLRLDPRQRPTTEEALALCEQRVDCCTRDVSRMAARRSDCSAPTTPCSTTWRSPRRPEKCRKMAVDRRADREMPGDGPHGEASGDVAGHGRHSIEPSEIPVEGVSAALTLSSAK